MPMNRIGDGSGMSGPVMGGPTAPTTGMPGWVAPVVGGAVLGGSMLAGALGGRNNTASQFRGSPLPYTGELDRTMADYGSLIGQYQRMSADPRSLGMAANLSNRQAALRGIQGPLAVGMANEAQSGVLRDFEAQRGQHLMSLMGSRAMLGQQLQRDEQQRRKEMWLREQEEAQARNARGAALWGGIGTVAGGVLGSVIPGAGTAVGAGIGGGLGTLGYNLFGG